MPAPDTLSDRRATLRNAYGRLLRFPSAQGVLINSYHQSVDQQTPEYPFDGAPPAAFEQASPSDFLACERVMYDCQDLRLTTQIAPLLTRSSKRTLPY